MSQIVYIFILLIPTICLHDYPLTTYCGPFSSQYQYLLNEDIYFYFKIWQNKLRYHGMFPILLSKLFKANLTGSYAEGKLSQCIMGRSKYAIGSSFEREEFHKTASRSRL